MTGHKTANHRKTDGGATLFFKHTTVFLWRGKRSKGTVSTHHFDTSDWIDLQPWQIAYNPAFDPGVNPSNMV
jgi:hypothetical protein